MLLKQIIAVVTVGAILVGCGGSGGIGGPLPGQNEPDVRVFNGVFGQPSVTATFRDESLNFLGRSTSAAYGGASNDTVLTNVPVTATINGAAGAIVTSAPTLVRLSSYYTTFAGGNASGNYVAFIVQDSQAVAPHRMIGIRAVHLGANTAPVDIYFSSTGTIQASNSLFTNLSYGNITASVNSPQAVDSTGYELASVSQSSAYTITVTAHGSQTPLCTTQVMPSQTDYYTVAIYDTAGGGGTSASVVIDTRQNFN